MGVQLAFSFYSPVYYSEYDYVVSCSNIEAYQFLSKPDKWSEGRLLVVGEEGSGKTHLASIWMQLYNATFVSPDSLLRSNKKAWVCEDIDRIYDEEFLFHIINRANIEGIKLLLTSRQLKAYKLQDLQSRINATSKILIKPPDDNLLRAILIKWFVDRQLAVSDNVIDYIITRIERSYKFVKILIHELDLLSLEEKRSITIPLVKKALKKIYYTN